jgi:cytochrome b
MAFRPQGPGLLLPMRVWDAPIRLFHWALVLLLVTSYVTAKLDRLDLHKLSGYTILTLLLFRVMWGFVGSDTARFSRFLRSPFAALRHLGHFTRREADTQLGHNEAGGWMVLVMLAVLGFQAVTGLFANDDVVFEGPLAKLVSKATSDRLSSLHEISFNVIEILVLLHVLAVIAYAVVKRHDLVRPMITGKKRLPAATPAPRMASPVLAVMLLALSACVVWVVVTKI